MSLPGSSDGVVIRVRHPRLEVAATGSTRSIEHCTNLFGLPAESTGGLSACGNGGAKSRPGDTVVAGLTYPDQHALSGTVLAFRPQANERARSVMNGQGYASPARFGPSH